MIGDFPCTGWSGDMVAIARHVAETPSDLVARAAFWDSAQEASSDFFDAACAGSRMRDGELMTSSEWAAIKQFWGIESVFLTNDFAAIWSDDAPADAVFFDLGWPVVCRFLDTLSPWCVFAAVRSFRLSNYAIRRGFSSQIDSGLGGEEWLVSASLQKNGTFTWDQMLDAQVNRRDCFVEMGLRLAALDKKRAGIEVSLDEIELVRDMIDNYLYATAWKGRLETA